MNEDHPKRPRGRPATLDTDKTLDIAMRAYWAEDPADVSVNEICKRAGVSKPSLYRGFGSEDGLMRAALDRYATQVLSGVFELLSGATSLDDTLDALIVFASRDPSMETGCLFYKMRAGKHRLGSLTRQRVEELEAASQEAYAQFLQTRQEAGDLAADRPISAMARYLSEQIALAISQRAAQEDKDQIKETLELALSVLRPKG